MGSAWKMQQLIESTAVSRLPEVHVEQAASERPAYAVTKRTFDIVFALSLLLVSLPVWLIVAALVRLTSPGPALYRQVRCGQNGQSFSCYKFRTMVNDADQQKDALRHLNELSGPVFKIRSDPRVTRVGRWLRKSSIDELPQLINVLRGEMSIVGPRPPLPQEVEQYGPYEWVRLAVKPGLTCLWQVSGRSDLDFPRWVALDREYIERRSFWLDLLIVVWTIPAVLTGRGAA